MKIRELKYFVIFFLFIAYGQDIQAQLAPQNKIGRSNSAVHLYFKKGVASFYHRNFQGRRTASGEKYSRKKLTAAHRTLPLNTMVKVTNLKNGKWVIVRINDRGPYNRKRLIDLSERSAKLLGLKRAKGLARVSVEEIPDSLQIWIHHKPSKINEKEVY